MSTRAEASALSDNGVEMSDEHCEWKEVFTTVRCCGKAYEVKLMVSLTNHKTVAVKAGKPKQLPQINRMRAYNPQSKPVTDNVNDNDDDVIE